MPALFAPTPTLAVGDVVLWAIVVVAAIIVLVVLGFVAKFFNLWIQALMSNAPVSFFSLLGMWLRKVNPRTIVLSRIQAVKAGLTPSTNQLETHYLARGNVPRVVNALIAADRAKIQLDWDTACAIDLAGRDILDAVQTSVNPKVIDCPSAQQG
ncbi:MAG: flotillin-like FloA family protein, partial [Planctomycetota bacterium]